LAGGLSSFYERLIDVRWSPILDKAQDDDQWFREFVASAIDSPAPRLPSESQRIGNSNVIWFPTVEGEAFIHAYDGTPDDRVLATTIVREQLKAHGIKQSHYSFDPEHKTAGWDDVMAKAKRLIQSNQVQILRNGYNNIVAHVVGDHGEYQTEIGRDDPQSRAITTWQCDCPWDQYAWQRTRQWKKFEGRPCAHVLAAYWKALSTPLDEDVNPATGEPNAQQQLFNAPRTAPSPVPFAAPTPAPVPSQQMQIPGVAPGQATGTQPAPAGPGVIPPFPMADAGQPLPVSVPGLRQPTPSNPMQWPGGTFSSVQNPWEFDNAWEFDTLPSVTSADFTPQPSGFQSGNMVSNKHEDWGTWVGRSEEHGAGSPAKIPKGCVGEVMSQDPSTKMVQVLFMDKKLGVQEHGNFMPTGATAWFFESELDLRPDVQRPGPAIKRR
jgi:hypothetical protein